MKISLSLLISLALFAGVAVLSFSGLFNRLQTAFFQPRVLAERGQAVTRLAAAVESYHLRNLERIAALLAERFIYSAFSSTGQQSREDIFNRGNLFGRLLEEYPFLQGVRLLDPDGRRIHFSTYRGDTQVAPDKQKVTYLNLAEVEKDLAGGELSTPAGQDPRLLIDAAGGRLIYSQAVVDSSGVYRGSAVFFFLKKDLEAALLREPAPDVREIALVGRLGLVAYLAAGDIAAPAVTEAWQRRASSGLSTDTLVIEGQVKEKYILLSLPAGRFGLTGLLVPYSAFELDPLMKAVFLAAVLLTVFLLVFLLFNLRQDPVTVLTQRVKRFQLEMLSEFIEGKERVDWQRWRDELVKGRAELAARIKRGVGRIPAGKEAELDGLIHRSWDEIIGIIEARIGQPSREKVDVGYIEQLLQKALDRGQITVARPLAAPAAALAPAPAVPAASSAAPPQPAPVRRGEMVVEEIGVEEVSDLEEAEQVAEEVAEAVEEVEEVVESAPTETVEELEEIEEVEEAEEAEEVEELVEATAPAAPAGGPPELAAEALAGEPAAPPGIAAAEPLEPLEELPQVSEIMALPREPQEELDELPPEEEAPEERPPAGPELMAVEEELEALEEQPTAIQELLASAVELEVEEQRVEAPRAAGSAAELDQLLARGGIRLYSAAEIENLIHEQRASVIMENGVYRIKEEVRTGSRHKAAGKGLKALAEAALGTEPDGEEESGISMLMGVDFGIDLATELGTAQAPERLPSFSDRRLTRQIQFLAEGLDYDQYLLQYRDGGTDTGQLKSLVEISRKIQAVNAALFVKAGEAYAVKLRVGLLDKPDLIMFSAGEPFFERCLRDRQAVLVDERPAAVPGIAAKFNPEDLRYMQAAVFIPATFRKSQAVLFLGLPTKKALDLKELILKLDIY